MGPSLEGPYLSTFKTLQRPYQKADLVTEGYSHDAQVINYAGADTDYNGREILVGSNENEIVIADVTEKANPVTISTIAYSNTGYTHQGWFTEDLNHFIVGDEKMNKYWNKHPYPCL